MGPIDALVHLLNLAGPALGTGLIGACLAKLSWRRELRSTSWSRLVVCSVGPALALVPVSLWFEGRDGRMASYAVLTLACAAGLWWAAFVRRR